MRRFPYLRMLATVCILSLTVQVAAPLFASPSTRDGVKTTVASLSTDNVPPSPKLLMWANSRPKLAGSRNLATNDLILGYPTARTQSVQEVAVLLHPRLVRSGERVTVRAIFANAPTGFVDVAFSCSDGQFVGSDGSPSTTFTTSASGATLRGFTFWRRAEAVWIAPDSPGRVTLQATLSIPHVYELSVQSEVEVRDRLPLRVECKTTPEVWVAHLGGHSRVEVKVRVLTEDGQPVSKTKIYITTDRAMLVTRRLISVKREAVVWEPIHEEDGLQEYVPVVRTGMVSHEAEALTESVDAFTDERGMASVYLEPSDLRGVANISIRVGDTEEVLPVLLLSPEGLRLMFSDSGLACNDKPEQIRAVLLNASGEPVAGQQVAFWSNRGHIEPAETVTNARGECTVALYSDGEDGYATVTATALGYTARHYTRVHGKTVPDTLLSPLTTPTIRINVYAPKDVRPAGAGFSQDETRGWVVITADNSFALPLSIYIAVDPVPYSGGHQHHSAVRPAGTCTPWQGILLGVYCTTYIAPEVCREAKINDISLQWGGLFDINADWRPPHYEHRRGRQVDFSNADNLPADLQRALRTIIGQYGGNVLNEGNHWHVRF
jgi:hypothetical protein